MTVPQPATYRLVDNDAYATFEAVLDEVVGTGGLTILFGECGTGKTTLAEHFTHQRTDACLLPPREKSVSAFVRCLFETFVGLPPAPKARVAEVCHEMLGTVDRPATAVIDNADELGADVLRTVAALANEPGRPLGIMLLATPRLEWRLRAAKLVRDQIDRWQLLPRLSQEEVSEVIRAFHPVWADAPDDLLRTLNRPLDGIFANWRTLTPITIELRATDPPPTWSAITIKLVRAATNVHRFAALGESGSA